MQEHIKHFFDFIEDREGRNPPLLYKLRYVPETLTSSDLYVNHNLSWYKRDIPPLPDNLTVNGKFGMTHCTNVVLPKGLHVKGNLQLIFSDVKSLPPDLIVDGELDLRHTPLVDEYFSKGMKRGEIQQAIRKKSPGIGPIDL
jgi:hypothetical protein